MKVLERWQSEGAQRLAHWSSHFESYLRSSPCQRYGLLWRSRVPIRDHLRSLGSGSLSPACKVFAQSDNRLPEDRLIKEQEHLRVFSCRRT